MDAPAFSDLVTKDYFLKELQIVVEAMGDSASVELTEEAQISPSFQF